jgi:hypothetical protein
MDRAQRLADLSAVLPTHEWILPIYHQQWIDERLSQLPSIVLPEAQAFPGRGELFRVPVQLAIPLQSGEFQDVLIEMAIFDTGSPHCFITPFQPCLDR